MPLLTKTTPDNSTLPPTPYGKGSTPAPSRLPRLLRPLRDATEIDRVDARKTSLPEAGTLLYAFNVAFICVGKDETGKQKEKCNGKIAIAQKNCQGSRQMEVGLQPGQSMKEHNIERRKETNSRECGEARASFQTRRTRLAWLRWWSRRRSICHQNALVGGAAGKIRDISPSNICGVREKHAGFALKRQACAHQFRGAATKEHHLLPGQFSSLAARSAIDPCRDSGSTFFASLRQ
jgi:hypothetical protein